MAERRIPAQVFPPGDYIREELDERGWTQRDLAAILDRPAPVVNGIVTGKTGITPETATDLAEAFGTSPQFWLNLDSLYRLSRIDAPQGAVRERARLYELAPVKDMERRGWIKKTKKPSELEAELKRFFDVESLDDAPSVRLAARASARDAVGVVTPEQLAWCIRARQLARTLKVPRYGRARCERGMEAIKALLGHAEDARKVPRVMADMGISFVVVKHLSRTKIDGAALWIDGNRPVIALSLRYDRIDYFWFTLVHELIHIVRKDGFHVDADILTEKVDEVEREVDREAGAVLVPQDKLESFIIRKRPFFSKAAIIQFAHTIGVHPGVVAGQLQYRKEINYAANREMLVGVRDIVTSEALTDGWGDVAHP